MHTSDDGEVFSDENIDNKVERECIRVRLLQMLDLSFIEGIWFFSIFEKLIKI